MSVAVIVIEVILLLIIVISAIKGLISGALKTVLTLVMLFVAFFVALLAGKWGAGFQIGRVDPSNIKTPMEKSAITRVICEKIEEKLVIDFEDAIARDENVDIRLGIGNKVSVKASEYFVDEITPEVEAAKQMRTTYESLVAYLVFGVIFIIVFAIILAILGKIAKASQKVGKGTAIGTVNKVLGLVLGALIGLVFCYAIVWCFNYAMNTMTPIMERLVTKAELDESILYKFLASFDVTTWF